MVDEVGYLPLDDLRTTIFFQLVSARYERSYGDWGSIFGDPIIATAILDRLLHHSTTINIRGESYRLKDRRKAGLVPAREQERAAGSPSLASASVSPKTRQKRRWAPLRPRPRRFTHGTSGVGNFRPAKGGIFNRR